MGIIPLVQLLASRRRSHRRCGTHATTIAYTPAQLAFGTGGPSSIELLPTLTALRDELAGLDLVIGQEVERDVVEGSLHTGYAAVV